MPVTTPTSRMRPPTASAAATAATRPGSHAARRRRVDPPPVERPARRDAEAAPLPDGEVNDAVVAAEHAAVKIDDVAGRGGAGPQALDHVGVAPGRNEADVLAVVLLGHREIEAARERAGLGLGHLAERKARDGKLRARGGEQEIALVAILVAGAVERARTVRQRARGEGMAGGEDARAEGLRA